MATVPAAAAAVEVLAALLQVAAPLVMDSPSATLDLVNSQGFAGHRRPAAAVAAVSAVAAVELAVVAAAAAALAVVVVASHVDGACEAADSAAVAAAAAAAATGATFGVPWAMGCGQALELLPAHAAAAGGPLWPML
jgi:ABC-type uncharacterized transport system ATPase subunit